MLRLTVYLFHHTSFFAVCSTNSVTLGRKSVVRKKKIDSGKTRLLCCARSGGPRTPTRTIDANLDCAFEDALVFVVQNI